MRVGAADAPTLEAMAANPSTIDRAEVAREFEALLLAQVWKGALASTGTSKLLDGGSAGQMYREMFIDEVMRRMPATHGLGLAERVVAKLDSAAKSTDATDSADSADATDSTVPTREGERNDG